MNLSGKSSLRIIFIAFIPTFIRVLCTHILHEYLDDDDDDDLKMKKKSFATENSEKEK